MLLQHEEISVEMFNHLISKNKLNQLLKGYGIGKEELEFIGELITATISKVSIYVCVCVCVCVHAYVRPDFGKPTMLSHLEIRILNIKWTVALYWCSIAKPNLQHQQLT